jgi:predicted Zn-dependent protease
MRLVPVLRHILGPLLLLGVLAACDSPAERAEAHYQRAVAYLAENDPARATVEFRNVFRLNPEHAAARLRYATLLRDQGDAREAMAQYLRLVDLAPNLAAGHRDLASLAVEVQDFDTAALHAGRAYALDPADPQTQGLKATIDFRDAATRPAAVALAGRALEADPGNVLARLVRVADRLAAQDPAAALAEVEAGLAAAPADESLHLARLALLEESGDTAAVGAELTELNRLLPGDEAVRAALVHWYLQAAQPAAAEALLRSAADAAAPGAPGPALTLAQFLLEVQGPEAARAELAARAAKAAEAAEAAAGDPVADAVADAVADPGPFIQALAALDFRAGRRDAAIAALRGQLTGAAASDASRNLKVALAEMLETTGDTAGSAALVAEVLAEDQTHLPALKLRARAAIAGDHPDVAVRDMRTALTVAPRDPEVMTIMAFAHERAGDRALMGERLALAVEVSNRAPEESLRYASFLMQEGRPGPAEGVVVDALRRAPENRELLGLLGRIHLARRDWDRAGQVAEILRTKGDPAAAAMAAALDTARLEGEGRPQAALPLLETLAGGGGGAAAMADLVRAQVAAGDIAGATAYVDGVLADDPDSLPGRFLKGGLLLVAGQPDAAEALYRAVIAADPASAAPHQALFALLAGQGEVAAAAAALDAGIAASPDNGRLLFTRAGLRESQGDLAGAIADYETLYARDSAEPVVANNLASLITARGPDPATLERAYAIARRLRESDVPEFQDTYGWILFLRGEPAAAQAVLAPAAAALPGNAQVQFHLAEAAFALGDRATAAAGYAAAEAAAAAGSPLPQAALVRSRRAELGLPVKDG